MIWSVDTVNDLLSGKYDRDYQQSALQIRARARLLLNEIDPERLDRQIKVLQWITNELEGKPFFKTEEEQDAQYALKLPGFTPAAHLYKYTSAFDLNDADNLTWSQYFALLALMLIVSAHQEEEWAYERKPYDVVTLATYRQAGDDIAFAMEAVIFGELLQINEAGSLPYSIMTGVSEQRISLNASKGGIARHSESNKLKKEFIDFYGAGSFKSGADAARRFYQSLPVERKILAPTNAERTLLDALREHRKKIP